MSFQLWNMTNTTGLVSELNYILMLKVKDNSEKNHSLLINDLNMMINNYEVVQNIIYQFGWNLFWWNGTFSLICIE